MAAVNPAATVSTAEGVAKRVHGKIQDLVPSKNLKAINRIKYDKSVTLGSEYVEPVFLTGEHGFTAGGSTGGKVTLNASEVAESQLASLTPSTVHFRTEVVIDLMSRAAQQGPQAFESYIAAMLRNSKKACDKRSEIRTLYGGTNIGTLTSATDAGTSSVFTIAPASWAPHIWLNSRNMAIDAYNGTDKLNDLADLNVTSVNPDGTAPTVTVTGNATDIDAIVAAGSSVQLYLKGYYGNDATGLYTIANLSTGSYLGISADNYSDAWQGTQISWTRASEEFTWQKLQSGLEEAAGRGAEGDLVCQVPYPVWHQLNNSLDALRMFDSSYSVNKTDVGRGVDSITYHGIFGSVVVEPSGFQKYGQVMCYPNGSDGAEGAVTPRRIGSTDWTFDVPARGGEMFRIVQDTNTVEYRAFTDQDLWLPAPRSCILFS